MLNNTLRASSLQDPPRIDQKIIAAKIVGVFTSVYNEIVVKYSTIPIINTINKLQGFETRIKFVVGH